MYRLNTESFYYDEADNIGVAINFTNGFCYTMNRIGTAIIREMLNGADLSEVITFFKSIAGCPPDFEEMARTFAGRLCDYGIIVMDDTVLKAEISLTAVESSEGFTPTIDEFRDAQDLILADPVHDIDPDLGWPEIN